MSYEIVEWKNAPVPLGVSDYKKLILNKIEKCDIVKKRCLLFYGPSRTSKSTLALSISKDLGKNVVVIRCPTFVKYRDPFERFNEIQECVDKCDIIIFDEIDFITPSRHMWELTNAKTKGLLGLVMEFINDNKKNKIIIGITNAKHQIDEAVLERFTPIKIAKMSDNDRIEMYNSFTSCKLTEEEKPSFIELTKNFASVQLFTILNDAKEAEGDNFTFAIVKRLAENILPALNDKKMHDFDVMSGDKT